MVPEKQEKEKVVKIAARIQEKKVITYIMAIKQVYKVWIGLATVRPINNNKKLGNSKGASFNVLHWACSKNDFKNKVKFQLNEYNYELKEIEDIEPFNFNLDHGDNLNELANIVNEHKSLQWGTFYTFS